MAAERRTRTDRRNTDRRQSTTAWQGPERRRTDRRETRERRTAAR